MFGAFVEIVFAGRELVVIAPVPVMFVCVAAVVAPDGCVGIVVGSHVVFAPMNGKGGIAVVNCAQRNPTWSFILEHKCGPGKASFDGGDRHVEHFSTDHRAFHEHRWPQLCLFEDAHCRRTEDPDGFEILRRRHPFDDQ